jgi:HTH-type transcriptional regulator, osmoprotectant uptake regulator
MPDSTDQDALRTAIITSYAEAYHKMGYSTLMGKIVALLLLFPAPMSLDDICDNLGMSKGPVSQIMRRLRDHSLVDKLWVPGERKDYYSAASDLFGQAFRNYRTSMRRNLQLANGFLDRAQSLEGSESAYITQRMHEMRAFYELMETHNARFLDDWAAKRQELSNPDR